MACARVLLAQGALPADAWVHRQSAAEDATPTVPAQPCAGMPPHVRAGLAVRDSSASAHQHTGERGACRGHVS